MTCPKEEVSRIWEDNQNLLVQDQKSVYGCLNQDCCKQVKTIIGGRFNIVTVTCLVITIYLLIFIVNMQYMFKVIQRYHIRFLNHKGDHFNLALTLAAVAVFLYLRFVMNFSQMGPPVVNFAPIVPKKAEVYSYYDIKDPKIKKELQVLELSQDPFLSHFNFKDINKVLPFSDPGCPPDGVCSENLQTLVKMHLVQSTDATRKPKNFFQLYLPENTTSSEHESLKELILKNETNAQGDVYVEGSIKQLRNLLKSHMIVKPSCLFDESIKIDIKVMYAIDGQYAESRSRAVSYEVA